MSRRRNTGCTEPWAYQKFGSYICIIEHFLALLLSRSTKGPLLNFEQTVCFTVFFRPMTPLTMLFLYLHFLSFCFPFKHLSYCKIHVTAMVFIAGFNAAFTAPLWIIACQWAYRELLLLLLLYTSVKSLGRTLTLELTPISMVTEADIQRSRQPWPRATQLKKLKLCIITACAAWDRR